jgi:hypothetical protein
LASRSPKVNPGVINDTGALQQQYDPQRGLSELLLDRLRAGVAHEVDLAKWDHRSMRERMRELEARVCQYWM